MLRLGLNSIGILYLFHVRFGMVNIPRDVVFAKGRNDIDVSRTLSLSTSQRSSQRIECYGSASTQRTDRLPLIKKNRDVNASQIFSTSCV